MSAIAIATAAWGETDYDFGKILFADPGYVMVGVNRSLPLLLTVGIWTTFQCEYIMVSGEDSLYRGREQARRGWIDRGGNGSARGKAWKVVSRGLREAEERREGPSPPQTSPRVGCVIVSAFGYWLRLSNLATYFFSPAPVQSPPRPHRRQSRIGGEN